MASPDIHRDHAAIYAHEEDRGVANETLADIGYRPPEALPIDPADVLAKGAVAAALEAAETSPTVEDYAQLDLLRAPQDQSEEPRTDPDEMIQETPPPPSADPAEDATVVRLPRRKPRRRLSARTQMFADGRGDDFNLR